MHLLTWRCDGLSSDVVQEIASRGLGLVYDLSDSAQREGLVQLLVGAVMEGKRWLLLFACTCVCSRLCGCHGNHKFCMVAMVAIKIPAHVCVLWSSRPAQSVSGDTKVFHEGTLGKAPEGWRSVLSSPIFSPSGQLYVFCRSRLTTYKELCSLASDLNQPDLVYRFMHLSNHNAIWESKKVCSFFTQPFKQVLSQEEISGRNFSGTKLCANSLETH